MLNDPVEAEDVVQDTFIRVWRAAEKWKPGQAKVSTWMCKIAVNLCLDRLRKSRPSTMENAPDPRDESATPAEQMESQERVVAVQAAMQELSNIEAAEVLDVSVDALESLLARGRRALKNALADAREDLMVSTPLGGSSGFDGTGI